MEAALIALQNIATLERLLFLFGGVLMGLALGAMAGLGGLVGLAILLPFTFATDPYAAFAVMIGLISVTSTANTILQCCLSAGRRLSGHHNGRRPDGHAAGRTAHPAGGGVVYLTARGVSQ